MSARVESVSMTREEKLSRMRELVASLDAAAKAYYVDGLEIMSNLEYDKAYDELLALESETGIILSQSPTNKVGYEVLSELPKEAHQSRMLSLDKTKSVEQLADFVGNQKSLLSWKLDGLTVVLTYENGRLAKAVTRGNGEIGEVITKNAETFVNLPVSIPYQDTLVLRGEAIITYADFAAINETIPEAEAKYKNPRNLCSGSVRQLNTEITAQRRVRFVAFSLVGDGWDTRESQFEFLAEQGFEVVDHVAVTKDNVAAAVADFAEKIKTYDYPSDGLVITYDDIAYGKSLGETAKFPRDSLAFKWQDEEAETVLREIEWHPSRTGLINPIACFDPVELEGTVVSRASVHNVSIVKELKLGIGDRIKVYKANMIIPQISENLTGSGTAPIPAVCPVCGGATHQKEDGDVITLYCTNEACPAKQVNRFALFAGRSALNIEGMSVATIEKLIDIGALSNLADFFRLAAHKEAIVETEGFGEKSYENMLTAAKKAADTTATRLLAGLGIAGVGSAVAGLIAKAGGEDMNVIRNLTEEELTAIDGVGPVLAKAFRDYFHGDGADAPAEADGVESAGVMARNKELDEILSYVNIQAAAAGQDGAERDLAGLTFVVTGSLEHYPNRDALKEEIVQRGGKVAGSVSSKTDFLINNDVASTSGKNKKAKELGIPIISEEDFLAGLHLSGR